MGTRGTFGVRIDGQDKLAYNHFDSYPEGLGLEILRQLKEIPPNRLITQARKLKVVSEEQKPTQEQIALCKRAGTVDLKVSTQSTSDWYCLTRGAQGDLIKTLKLGIILDGNNFPNDSLFCEWGYIVNLDTGKLEVYRGFNHAKFYPEVGWGPEHTEGRYAHLMDDHNSKKNNPSERYYGIYLIAEFPLNRLPSEKTFLKKVDS